MSLRDLITLGAFHAHPKNAKLPLAERIAGEQLLLLGVGAQQVRAAIATVPKTIGAPILPMHSQLFQKRGTLADMLGPLRRTPEYAKAKHVLIVVQHGWKVYLRNGYFEGAEINRKLRLDPAGSIDETEAVNDVDVVPYQQSDAYAALVHPNADRLLLFAAPSQEIAMLHDSAEDAGLKVVGCKIAPLGALEHFYATQASDDPDELSDILYVDRHSYLLVQNGRPTPDAASTWTEIRYASKRAEEVIENMAQAIRERPEPNRSVILLAGDTRAQEVKRLFPSLGVKSPFENEHFDALSACAR